MSARSLNKVQLIGNLTRDPELRFTPQGTAVCSFGLATNRSWNTDTGDKREETEFHRIVAWAKLAELCSQLLFKGRRVYVEGRLQTRKWTAQDGAPRSTTEVVIDDMIILDSKYEAGGGGDYGGNGYGGGGRHQQHQQQQDDYSQDDYDYSQGPDGDSQSSPPAPVNDKTQYPSTNDSQTTDNNQDQSGHNTVDNSKNEDTQEPQSNHKNDNDKSENESKDIPF